MKEVRKRGNEGRKEGREGFVCMLKVIKKSILPYPSSF